MNDSSHVHTGKHTSSRMRDLAIAEARKIFQDPQVGEDAAKTYLTYLNDDLTDDDIKEFISVLHDRYVAETSFIQHYSDWVCSQHELNDRMLRVADTVDNVAGTSMNFIGAIWYLGGVVITLTLGKIGIQIPILVSAVKTVVKFAAYTASLLPYGIACVYAYCKHLRFRSSLFLHRKQTEFLLADLRCMKSCDATINSLCPGHVQMVVSDHCGVDEVDHTPQEEKPDIASHLEEELTCVTNMYDLIKSSVEVHIGPGIGRRPTLRNVVKKLTEEEERITGLYNTLTEQPKKDEKFQ